MINAPTTVCPSIPRRPCSMFLHYPRYHIRYIIQLLTPVSSRNQGRPRLRGGASAPATHSDARFRLPGRAKHGLGACAERGLPRMANHRLSARCRIAKAQKVCPQHCALLSVLRASPGWPSMATRRTHAFDPGTGLRRPERRDLAPGLSSQILEQLLDRRQQSLPIGLTQPLRKRQGHLALRVPHHRHPRRRSDVIFPFQGLHTPRTIQAPR